MLLLCSIAPQYPIRADGSLPQVRALPTSSKSRDVESFRCASICAFKSATICSAVAIASAPAINRRGGGSWLAMVMSARASFAGSPDLLAILGFPKLELLRSALVVVLDGWLGVVRRLLREEFRAEEPRVDDGGGDAERRDLRVQRFHPALEAEFRRGVGANELEACGEAR